MSVLSRKMRESSSPETAYEPYSGPTWEYRTLNLNFKASIAMEDEFNKLGRQGWEFQAMVERGSVHRAIFKRLVNDESPAPS